MIKVYHKKSCYSSRKAQEWLNLHNINYSAQPIEKISKDDLLLILSLTENGIEDIVKFKPIVQTQIKIDSLADMTVSAAIDYIKQNPEILRIPIIFTKNKLLVGYSDVEIRQFISHSKRQYKF